MGILVNLNQEQNPHHYDPHKNHHADLKPTDDNPQPDN